MRCEQAFRRAKINYVPKICSRYRFWTHFGTFKHICSPRYRGGRYVSYMLLKSEDKETLLLGKARRKFEMAI